MTEAKEKMLAIDSEIETLDRNGFILFDQFFEECFLEKLRADVAKAAEICCQIQKRKNVGQSFKGRGADGSLMGAAHNVLCLGDSFLELLEKRPHLDLIEHTLDSKIILNSYGAITNIKNSKMYEHGMMAHRDTRTFREYPEMFFVLVMLDDFSEENGATHLLAGSHKNPEQPDKDYFFKNAARAIGKAGSIAIFDPRVWHAAGINTTDLPRRALTISFTRPSFKPQFDFVRSVGMARCESFSDNLKQLLGYYSRTPASHEEWYQEPENRYYRMDQG